jgi:hypothetical protein
MKRREAANQRRISRLAGEYIPLAFHGPASRRNVFGAKSQREKFQREKFQRQKFNAKAQRQEDCRSTNSIS